MKKKLVLGITASASTILIKGQMQFFTEQGYNTYLLAPKDDRTLKYCLDEGGTLLPITIKRDISLLNDLSSLAQIIKHFKRISPDIINIGTPKVSLLGMLAAKITGVPLKIYTCRGFRFEHETGLKRKILISMERISGFFANKIICISPSVEKLSHSLSIFPKNKTIVIKKGSSNGIDIQRFNREIISEYSVIKLKKELSIEGKFVFGFVGRLVDRKGISEIYHVFNDLHKINSNLRFLFVGGIEIEQVSDKNLVKRIKNHPGIIYVGPQDDVPLYLTLMDVFVLPAWWEGFGNVLVQAAAMGLPVISTNATGCMDAVSNGYNGVLIQPKSIEELSNAMIRLYNDEELRNFYGRNGVIWAKNFDSKSIWHELNNLYNQ
jgi:glycosyltransferase involved in cell wall biosynthesis